MVISIVFLLILIPLILGIPILVAVYVYRDANKRGMNAILWMLIALLTPSLLGLIIYLLVRNNYSDLKCPRCDTRVEESFVVCPTCRTKLRPTCPSCAAPVQTTWQVCPHCGTSLEFTEEVTTPVHTKDKTLWKILIAILVIPVVIILLLIALALPFSMSSRSGGYATGFAAIPVEEYLADCTPEEKIAVEDWLEAIQSGNYTEPYHVLEYEGEALPAEYDRQYLIYIPGACGYLDSSSDLETEGFFRKRTYLELDILCDEKSREQLLFLFNYNSNDFDPPHKLVITYNDVDGDSSLSTYSAK